MKKIWIKFCVIEDEDSKFLVDFSKYILEQNNIKVTVIENFRSMYIQKKQIKVIGPRISGKTTLIFELISSLKKFNLNNCPEKPLYFEFKQRNTLRDIEIRSDEMFKATLLRISDEIEVVILKEKCLSCDDSFENDTIFIHEHNLTEPCIPRTN